MNIEGEPPVGAGMETTDDVGTRRIWRTRDGWSFTYRGLGVPRERHGLSWREARATQDDHAVPPEPPIGTVLKRSGNLLLVEHVSDGWATRMPNEDDSGEFQLTRSRLSWSQLWRSSGPPAGGALIGSPDSTAAREGLKT